MAGHPPRRDPDPDPDPDRLDGWLLDRPGQRADATAVLDTDPDGRHHPRSYADLRRQVDAWAAELWDLDLELGSRVVVDAHNGAAAVALLLACSRAGLTYVPVSPEAPPARLRSIVAAAQPALHLRAPDRPPPEVSADGAGSACFAWGADLAWDRRPGRAGRGRRVPTATDPAYIIFTSGTTGVPKGVVMSHRAVVTFFRAMLAEGLVRPADRLASTSPLQFDFSLLDLGMALGAGATLVPVPRRATTWPRALLAFLDSVGATHVNGVPSVWRPVLRTEPSRLAGLTRLRGVVFSGEEFPLPELRALQAALPAVRIVNCYGPTECMAVSFTDVPNPLPASVTRLSIGNAHRGAEMLLVDDDGRPVTAAGEVGHIHVRTPAAFSGYWADPARSNAALVPDPVEPRSGQLVLRTGDLGSREADGGVRFHGRADSMVKIRGNRVELGEVEHHLCTVSGLAAAVVLAVPDTRGELELRAFVVTGGADRDGVVDRARRHCVASLPAYMVPSRIEVVDAVPTTVNGKLDRRAVARP